MKRKNNYIMPILIILLYFLVEFIINFLFIKWLGGYDNQINYDLSIICSRLIVAGLFFVTIMISNKKVSDYIGFKGISSKKIFLYFVASILYSYAIVLISNDIFECAFHLSNKYDYYLISAILVAPLYEEIFKKIIPIEFLLKKNISPIFITLFISFLFSINHLPSLEQMCYTFFLTIITSLIYLKERNYLYPIIFHLIYNFIVLCVY
ncbi:hypothetical protein CLU97_0587 [Chryseobacterium sp. 7]|uniref:CPBP family intramembrane glutamic endopeptidase n=1 Tax=Chryseobacterium sp. 7 TaxID=2035214 RepID=UPI000EB5B1B1|nr:CPBP family intramembrane glutamic endopeptidase [Chryseobacterium sp. 7]RLJ31180.1 hypothetical protein CLU97_0587 [Chryseobacterium sp. 7]